MKEQIAEVELAAEKWSPQHTLAWAFETFGNRVAISSAFGAEGMVLIDIASRVGYLSDTAFSIAFKRWTGQSPGRFRAESRRAASIS